jgi:hypothetical protein
MNPQCRNIAKIFTGENATMVDGVCSYCGSISPTLLRESLEAGVDAHWIEPLPEKMVTGVYLSNGKRFFLSHLEDDELTEQDAKDIQELLEEVAGNLRVFYKELNKWFT